MDMLFLSDLKQGERARITGLFCAGKTRKRLTSMGAVKDAQVLMCGRAPFGDPIWVRVQGYYLSMRLSSAQRITVERLP